MSYSEKKLADVLHLEQYHSNLPAEFNINNIENETIHYFLRFMHKTLVEEYFNDGTIGAVGKCFAKLDELYKGKPKTHGDIFVFNCYDIALNIFLEKLKD